MTNLNRSRLWMLAGAAVIPFGISPAAAETTCSQAVDGAVACTEEGSVVATGTLTPGTVTPGPGLHASSSGDLSGGLTGDINTDADGVASVLLTATGNIDYTQVGLVSSEGEQASAVLVDAVGDASVRLVDVSTSGAGAAGIHIEAGADSIFDEPLGTVDLACNSVTTTGAGSTAIQAFSNNRVNLSCGEITTTGAGARGIILSAEYADVELGDVTAAGDGIYVGTLDFGSIRLAVDNVVTTGDGATGIDAYARDGVIRIDCGSVTTYGNGSAGISTYASDGGVGVACGDIRTEGDSSDGAQLIEAGFALGNITTLGNDSDGLYVSSLFGSSGTVGNITTSGNGSQGIISFYSGSTEIVAGDVTTSGNDSTAVLISPDGYVDLDLGQVRTSGSESHGILIYTEGYTSDIDVTVAGVEVTGSGADAVRIGSEFGSPANVAISFATSGDILSSDGAALTIETESSFDFVVAEGLTAAGRTAGVDITAGGTGLNIAGMVSAAEGPAVRAVGGNATVDIAETGVIDGHMIFGAGADRVTNMGTFTSSSSSDFGGGNDLFTNRNLVLINGDVALSGLETFANVGGTIDMQDGAPDDRFAVDGAYAGSEGASVLLDVSRSLDAADVFAVGGSVSGETILAINWVDSSAPVNAGGVLLVDGVSDPDAFIVEGLEDFGLFALTLRARDGDLYLMAAIDPAVTDLALLGAVAPDSWYQSFDALRASITGRGSFLPRLGFWAQAYGGKDRRGGTGSAELFGSELAVSSRLETDRLGAQIGFDGSVAGVLVGATAGYEQSKSEAGLASDIEVKGWNVGAYAGVGAAIGPYAVATVKHDRLDIDADVPTLALGNLDGHSTGGDIEAGWRGSLLAASVDLNAGVSVVRSSIDGFVIDGTDFDPGSATSVRGRIGGRVTLNGPFRPFAEARLFNEFGDRTATRIVSGDIDERLEGVGRGAWARVEAGIGGGNDRALLSGWAEFGDREGWGLRAGYKF